MSKHLKHYKDMKLEDTGLTAEELAKSYERRRKLDGQPENQELIKGILSCLENTMLTKHKAKPTEDWRLIDSFAETPVGIRPSPNYCRYFSDDSGSTFEAVFYPSSGIAVLYKKDEYLEEYWSRY